MANPQKITVPDIGDFSAVEVIEVLIEAGQSIEREQSLVVLESDKAAMEIPAPVAGVITSVAVKVGDRVGQGDLLALVELVAGSTGSAGSSGSAGSVGSAGSAEADSAPAATAETAAPPPEPPPQRLPGDKEHAPPPLPASDDLLSHRGHASPSVRRFARELGVEILQVKGSGRKARVTKEDVRSHVKRILSGGETRQSGPLRLPALPEVDFSAYGEIEQQPLSRIKKRSGVHLQGCWLNIPHVTQFDEADIGELEAFRTSLKEEAQQQGLRLTPMPFILKATVAALKAMPEFNSSLSSDGESLILKRYYHIGVAVDTPNGLVVPVLRNVDQKSLFELARELGEISEKARKGRLGPDEMRGGTFTISSLGGIGGSGFTPIVNAPEVAILGLSRSKMQPVWNGREFAPRLILPFSVSYDHRVIDGVQGVRFTTLLARLLGDIRRL